ncbi:hypothetical protein FPV67DRAFT_1007911 [Lyophyllum atratum]|nr:hypothetical protein FPV67DRAFT_1007911 [Lyophyllum atratum]
MMFSRVTRSKFLSTPPRAGGTRTASTTNSYPFPSNRHPSPHQIFHLPPNASEIAVDPDFDLVRIYHPDKAGPGVPSEVAHARFQSITAAYDALRGKTPLATSPFAASSSSSQDSRYPTTAAWRARSRRQELYTVKDERWKDRIMLAGVIATVMLVVAQVFSTRRQALAEAVARHRDRDPDAFQRTRTPVAVSSLDPHDPDRRLGE